MFRSEIDLIADRIGEGQRKTGRRVVGLALLGMGNGSGTLIVPNGLPREIYARRSDTRELFTLHLPPNPTIPFQDGNAAVETLEVRYGYEADSTRLQVLDTLSASGQQGIGATSPMEAAIAAGYWTPLNQIVTLRGRPTNPVSMSVAADGPFWYPRTATSKFLFSTGTAALSAAIGALTAGQHQLAIEYLDTATGQLGVITNTAVTATGTLPSRGEWVYTDVQAMSIASTYLPISVVYLYYGQTGVQEADFYRNWDLRPLFGGGANTALSNIANQSANQVFAGPTSGGAAAPAFRALVAADYVTMVGDSGSGGVKGAVAAPAAGDAAAAKFWKADGTWAVPPGGSSGITAKNVSGVTANAGDVGILSYDVTNGYSYTTTTTANLEGTWCVVTTGGANNANIVVARQGQVTVKLNANCAIGNFLTTSTTAGQAAVNTTMRPEVFAVALTANVGGAGGTCTAMLITSRKFIQASNANYIFAYVGGSLFTTRDFVGTINGAPSGTSVVVTPVSGSTNNMQNISGHISDAKLYNTTRGTQAFISSMNGGTNTITVTAAGDISGWQSGDTITIRSTTCDSGAAYKYGEYKFNSGASKPPLAVAFLAGLNANDTAAAQQLVAIHPYETFGSAKQRLQWTQVANVTNTAYTFCPIIDSQFCASWTCNGATGQMFCQLYGWIVAEP